MADPTDAGLLVNAAKKHKAEKSNSPCPIPNTEATTAGPIDTGCLVKASKENKADDFKRALALSISVSYRGSARGYLNSRSTCLTSPFLMNRS